MLLLQADHEDALAAIATGAGVARFNREAPRSAVMRLRI